MNILIINHYAGSNEYGMEYRPYYIAKEWVKQGHIVTIIAASYSHLRQIQPTVKEDFQEEFVDGIRYVWLKTPKYNGPISRIYNILSFIFKLLVALNKISKLYNPEIVIASSTYPLDNIPCHRIAKISNAKYIYELHDIWPLSPMVIGGYSKYHPYILLMQWAENYAYKYCHRVVSLLWNTEEHTKQHGLKDGKLVCIPNGYNPDEWANEVLKIELPQEHTYKFGELKEKVIVGFAGGFAASGALMTLLKAAKILKNYNSVHFVLVGKGNEEKMLKEFVKDNSLTNVSFLSSISKNRVPRLISEFDICYYGGVHSILHKYGTSANKLTDYMLAGKPIIQAIDEPGSLVERIMCGIRVEAENDKEVAEAILKLVNMKTVERERMGSIGKEYAKKELQWSSLSKRFIENIL